MSDILCFSPEWSFPKEKSEEILKISNIISMKNFLVNELNVLQNFLSSNKEEKFTNPTQQQILINYYYFLVTFGLEKKFSPQKLSTLFGIMKKLLILSLKDNYSMEDSFLFFRKLLVKHSMNRPPFNVEVFDLNDIKEISKYVVDSFFKHFKLYQFCFCQEEYSNFEIKTIDEKLVLPFKTKSTLKEFMDEKTFMEKRRKETGEKEKQVEEIVKEEKVNEPKKKVNEVEEEIPEKKEKEEVKPEIEEPKLNKYVVQQLNEVQQLLVKFHNSKMSVIDEKLKELETMIENINVTKK